MPTVVEPDPDVAMRITLALIAPGTALREGMERILAGNTGALIVLGNDKVVQSMSTGGFPMDVEFAATRMRELAKMDGAVILSADLSRIIRAGVHLMPDPSIPTEESGTRHRTAERVAIQTGLAVISVSQSMRIISVYVAGRRHTLEHPTTVLSRANQALATLERYKLRLDEVAGTLLTLEIEDLVTVRDAMSVSQRLEMVRRIADEILGYVMQLGTDGRLLSLQLDELLGGMEDDRELLARDYLFTGGRKGRTASQVLGELHDLSSADLLDLTEMARAFGFPLVPEVLDNAVSPRGYRLLNKVPRLPATIIHRLVDHFGALQKLLAATTEDLQAVDGVGEARARSIREGLSRLAENSILDRYV
ncbi:MAG: DNA integrity scanning diadenylate cyclase DisA [Geodermatophilaceae bacterium]